jgi:hypothetical protein
MPLERVAAREEIPTVVTEVDLEWVHLRGFTVALEHAHVFSRASGQTQHLISLTAHGMGPVSLRGCEQCLPCLEVLRNDLEELVLLCSFLLLFPSQHSPRPKSAVRRHLLPPTPAGILIPARVNSDFPVNLGPQPSSLRSPLPWALCLLLFSGSLLQACGESSLRTVLPESPIILLLPARFGGGTS